MILLSRDVWMYEYTCPGCEATSSVSAMKCNLCQQPIKLCALVCTSSLPSFSSLPFPLFFLLLSFSSFFPFMLCNIYCITADARYHHHQGILLLQVMQIKLRTQVDILPLSPLLPSSPSHTSPSYLRSLLPSSPPPLLPSSPPPLPPPSLFLLTPHKYLPETTSLSVHFVRWVI